MSESTRTLELAAPAPLSSSAAALAMAEAGAAAPLSRNFLRAQKLYGDVESSRLGGADAALQRQVGEALALCEVALKQVVGLSVFSSNEMVDDVNTGDLKYLLLPFYRGELLQRVVDQPRRRELLGESLACLRGFLDDLERMEALTAEARAAWRADGEPSAAADPAAVREAKIARVKASKAARDRMAVLAERQRGLGEDDDGTLPRNFFGAMARNSHRSPTTSTGEELEREHLLLLLKCATHTALDSIRSATQELDMLEQMEKLRRPDGSLPPPPPPPPEHERPRTFTLMPASTARYADPRRDPASRLSYETAMQQLHTGVIPGLYTLSVEEGMRQEEAERALAEAQRSQESSARAAEKAAAKQEREEAGEEDAEELYKTRAMDDYKDTHTKGAGNRYNRT